MSKTFGDLKVSDKILVSTQSTDYFWTSPIKTLSEDNFYILVNGLHQFIKTDNYYIRTDYDGSSDVFYADGEEVLNDLQKLINELKEELQY